MKESDEVQCARTLKFVDLCAGLGGFHQGLGTAAESAAMRFGTSIRFECVAAAELERDLRQAYVANFPEIANQYRRFHRNLEMGIAGESPVEGPLWSALPQFDETGALLEIHGDMELFLNDKKTGLRHLTNGKPLLPRHDLLCAGFPCQPFSKSGAQRGFDDTRGTVFHTVATILREHHPAFLILENVGNFPKHDSGNTWNRVKKILTEELDYDVVATSHIGKDSGGGLLSPHHLGYPHHRERFFIVGQRRLARQDDSKLVKSLLARPLNYAEVFPSIQTNGTSSSAANQLLDQRAKSSLIKIIGKEKEPWESEALLASQISTDRVRCINHWGELLSNLAEQDRKSGAAAWRDSMPSFPIWGYELDPWQWYPSDCNPSWYSGDPAYLSSRRKAVFSLARVQVLDFSGGSVDLNDYPPAGDRWWLSKNFTASRITKWIDSWPAYAGKREVWPWWKQRFINQNREFAVKLWSTLNPTWLRGWLDTLYDEIETPSLQKLEWNCKGAELDIWAHILQFRPSGLRVKRFAHVPALVAMTTTQIPIVPRINQTESRAGSAEGSKGRHLIASEALELQGFPPSWKLPPSRERAFTCFGNAVHVGVVHDITLNWLLRPANRTLEIFTPNGQISSPLESETTTVR